VHPITAAMKIVNLALPDVTLRLDLEGVIRDVSFANSISTEASQGLLGRPWDETVGEIGGSRIRDMVADARANGVSAFRQVTQRFPSGLELPIEYNAVRLGGRAGLIAVGRNLQAVIEVQSQFLIAQQAREHDAWRLRGVETRYRLLFETSHDPILLLSAADSRIMDANPAAFRALAFDAGPDFLSSVAPAEREAFRETLGRVREHGRAPGILLHIGAAGTPWMVRASLATAAPEDVVLLQLTPAAARTAAAAEPMPFGEIMEFLPDGFILIDPAGTILRANRAFLELIQVVVPALAVGQKLGRWLSRPGADAATLLAYAGRHRVLRSFSTSLTGELGIETEVEISVSADLPRAPRYFALLFRDISRRLPVPAAEGLATTTPGRRLIGALASLTDEVGRVPLLKLVRDTGGLLEQHYIERALEKANGNRTAAAELLGLSRQSFYAKLSRYRMTDGAESEAAASTGD